MSMISEQIQALRDLSVVYSTNGLAKVFTNAADTIEELSAKLATANMERSTDYYNGGWIPCSAERFTVKQPNGEYSVFDIFSINEIVCHDENGRNSFTMYEGAVINKLGFIEDLAEQGRIAYLPEPYKGVE